MKGFVIKKLERFRSAELRCDNDQSVKVIESVLDFSDQAFALSSGIKAQMVSRRNLKYRLELRALPSVHLWRGV